MPLISPPSYRCWDVLVGCYDNAFTCTKNSMSYKVPFPLWILPSLEYSLTSSVITFTANCYELRIWMLSWLVYIRRYHACILLIILRNVHQLNNFISHGRKVWYWGMDQCEGGNSRDFEFESEHKEAIVLLTYSPEPGLFPRRSGPISLRPKMHLNKESAR